MTHVPHELAEEFQEHIEKLHELKLSNSHFVKLSDEYHVINREIHRIETGVEPVAEYYETQLRKQRINLKDQIAAIILAE